MRRALVLWSLLAGSAVIGGCAGREVYHVRGCDERLASGYKREECRACVTRPRPHVYLPDRPDGTRCAPR